MSILIGGFPAIHPFFRIFIAKYCGFVTNHCPYSSSTHCQTSSPLGSHDYINLAMLRKLRIIFMFIFITMT
nr:MAG TPA: hypothetical protein [Bacteriophage sp.]